MSVSWGVECWAAPPPLGQVLSPFLHPDKAGILIEIQIRRSVTFQRPLTIIYGLGGCANVNANLSMWNLTFEHWHWPHHSYKLNKAVIYEFWISSTLRACRTGSCKCKLFNVKYELWPTLNFVRTWTLTSKHIHTDFWIKSCKPVTYLKVLWKTTLNYETAVK